MEALGLSYLRKAQTNLRSGQILVLAGCFSGDQQDVAWEISGSNMVPTPIEMLQSDAQEADMRVWRHALQTEKVRVLIYSPDTDVYNIGLTLVQPPKQYVVQINLPRNTPRYVNVNQLLKSFQCDPDLASLSLKAILAALCNSYT